MSLKRPVKVDASLHKRHPYDDASCCSQLVTRTSTASLGAAPILAWSKGIRVDAGEGRNNARTRNHIPARGGAIALEATELGRRGTSSSCAECTPAIFEGAPPRPRCAPPARRRFDDR